MDLSQKLKYHSLQKPPVIQPSGETKMDNHAEHAVQKTNKSNDFSEAAHAEAFGRNYSDSSRGKTHSPQSGADGLNGGHEGEVRSKESHSPQTGADNSKGGQEGKVGSEKTHSPQAGADGTKGGHEGKAKEVDGPINKSKDELVIPPLDFEKKAKN